MAIVKPLPNEASLKVVLNYVMQSKKTLDLNHEILYVGGQNCIPEYAFEQMSETKKIWDKEDGRQYKHVCQSFANGDFTFEDIESGVAAKVAHEIGLELAEKMFQGFEVVIATHLDKVEMEKGANGETVVKKCQIHNHFVINSVHLDTGLKINFENYGRAEVNKGKIHVINKRELRKFSNAQCRERGLSILDNGAVDYERADKHMSVSAKEKIDRVVKNLANLSDLTPTQSHKLNCYRAVVDAYSAALNHEDFITKMEAHGWKTDWTDNHKHIVFKNAENPKQSHHLTTLANDYEFFAKYLGEHERLPLDKENQKLDLMARFEKNANAVKEEEVMDITKTSNEAKKDASQNDFNKPKQLTHEEIKEINRAIIANQKSIKEKQKIEELYEDFLTGDKRNKQLYVYNE